MGTTVAIAVQVGSGSRKEIGKYAKSVREQKKSVRRQIRVSQKRVRAEKRGVKAWRVVKKILGWLVIMAQLAGSVIIVAALFRTEALTMWQNGLVIMGLTMLLFINGWALL